MAPRHDPTHEYSILTVTMTGQSLWSSWLAGMMLAELNNAGKLLVAGEIRHDVLLNMAKRSIESLLEMNKSDDSI